MIKGILFYIPTTLLKKRPPHKRFTVNFAKFLGKPFLQKKSRQLLRTLTEDSYQEFISYTLHDLNNHFILKCLKNDNKMNLYIFHKIMGKYFTR